MDCRKRVAGGVVVHDQALRSIVIVGGGTAGWMTAAALAHAMPRGCAITLVESDEIGTVGVGEATIPPIRLFNETLGIAEADFLKNTKGSFKLGIEFVGWGGPDRRYFHPFGTHGKPFDLIAVHQHWLAARDSSPDGALPPLDALSMAWGAAKHGRFAAPVADPRSVASTFDYAYHFDAGLYAAFLRRYAEARGVARIEGKVLAAERDPLGGDVATLRLADGRALTGDFFVDCSGFRGLLIEGALATGYEDWTHWLPCDRAVAMPCVTGGDGMTPYTRSTARPAGWQWRIPLQHRTGNGYVYASAHVSDDEAAATLAANLDGPALGEPRFLRFVTGRRRKFWNRNVVAIGLAGGFMEPLESTSIHLIQAGIAKLLAYLPTRQPDPLAIEEYNRVAIAEFERIRDFLILHYKLNADRPEPMWQAAAAMSVPDTLAAKIEHFRARGRLVQRENDLFGAASWLAVHIGQGNLPQDLDPLLAYRADPAASGAFVTRLAAAIESMGRSMPTHADWIARIGARA
nr:tryptophan 7-halogenase [Sphingomonas sp. GV3]